MIKLFCIPYSGASSSFYYNWKGKIGDIEIVPVELKGKGSRFKEGLYSNFNEAVDDVYKIILSQIDGPYAIFGHSIGSLLTAMVTLKIQLNSKTVPKVIFCTGRDSPTVVNDIMYHKLSDSKLIEFLENLGGIDESVLLNEEYISFFLPNIRNDFRIIETFHFPQTIKIDCEVVVVNGKQDPLCKTQGSGWKNINTKKTSIYSLEGNHFFIHTEFNELIKIIENFLKNEE